MNANARHLAAPAVAGAVLLAAVAHAQPARPGDFPSRALRIVAPSAPGATTDIVSRLLAQHLSERIGQQVVVDNRPGAGGNVSAELVAKASPDGHTLLLGIPGLATNPALYGKLSYDPQRDLAPVTLVGTGPLALVVSPSIPATNVTELIAHARAHPRQLNFPSVGAGTTSHLAVELFNSLAGIEMVHVPYKNFGQAMLDLGGGRVQVMINAIPGLLSDIRAGKVRALAVTSAQRSAALPQLPTVMEAGLRGFEVVTWNGILVPAGTPAGAVSTLNGQIGHVLALADLRARFAAMGFEPMHSTPARFAALIRSETERWGKIIKATGARAD